MKKLVNYCSIILLLLLATSQVKAQSVDVVIRENGTERKESIDLPMSMTYPLDSLLNDWKAKNYIDLGKDCSTAEVNPLFSDSVYMDRLSRIPAIMEMPYNDIVRKFIDMYAGRLRNQVSFMLSACNFYMPIFEEALDAYGLPLELKYLPDVYKRQLEELFFKTSSDLLCDLLMLRSLEAHTVKPVSYTHLDVYKRQRERR